MEYICGCNGQYNRLTSQVGGNKTQGEDARKEIKDVQTEKFDFFFFYKSHPLHCDNWISGQFFAIHQPEFTRSLYESDFPEISDNKNESQSSLKHFNFLTMQMAKQLKS